MPPKIKTQEDLKKASETKEDVEIETLAAVSR
jgi:hypothetical protein